MPRLPKSSAGNQGLGDAQVRGAGLPVGGYDLTAGQTGSGSKAGSGFGGLADVVQVFDTARRENEFQKGKVEAYSTLRDLRTRIEQDPELDAEGILQRHDEGVEGLRSSLAERYKDDGAILNKLMPLVDNFANEQAQHMRHFSRLRIVDRGKADGMANDSTLLSTLDKASGPKDFDFALQLHDEDVASKVASGVYGAVEAQKRKALFAGAVDELRQKYTEKQRVSGIYSTLYRQFGKNPYAGVKFLENPENWERVGIPAEGHKDAMYFIGEFEKKAARDKRHADEAREAGARAEMTAYWKAVDKGDLDEAGRVLTRARSIGGGELVRMKQALKKDQWDDDPKVVADVQRRIWSGELTDSAQIAPLMGNGLSPRSAKTLREDMEKIDKDKPPFDGAMNFYTNAVKRYEAMFKDTDLAGNASTFAATLAYQARQKKIGPYDPRMDTLADEILTVVEKPLFFGRDKTRFEQQMEAKTLPGVPTSSDAAPAMPAARPVPAPQAKASSIQQIPAAEYSAVKQALASAGKDTSDETVLSVWLANRAKLKGAK